jgi:hypothetical protein
MKNLQKLIFAFVVIMISCTKENSKKEETLPAITYSLSVIELLPMQLVSVQASEKINQDSLTALVNNQSIILRKTGEKDWSFICPVLNPGAYKVKVNGLFELVFTIKNYIPIQNPASVISDFKTEVSQLQINILATNLINKQNLIDNLNYLNNGLDEVTLKLTTAEKLQMAYFINSNGYDNANFSEMLNTNLPDSFLGKGIFFDPTDATDVFIIKFVNARINGIISISTAVALFLAPDPTFITKGLGVLASISAIANMAVLYRLIDADLPNLISRAIDIEAVQKKALELNFKMGQNLSLNFKSNFNNTVNSDKVVTRFPILFKGIDEANNKIQSFFDAYIYVKSWFGGTQPLNSSKVLSVGNLIKQKTFYLNSKYLTVKSVSNPEIKVELSNVGTEVYLKAISSSIKVKTKFTLVIKYTQVNLNNSIEKTFDATYEPGFDLLGTWNCINGKLGMKNYFDYTDEWEVDCFKTAPPTKIKLIDVIKRDFIKWHFKNATDLNWLEKGSEVRQLGIDENCKNLAPQILKTDTVVAYSYTFDGSILKFKVDNEELIWTFEKISDDEFKVQTLTPPFAFTFKKQ